MPLSVLAVDDNPINLQLLKATLGKEGYDVVTADNGPDARRIAVDTLPDIILLDIQMPRESGFDVIRFLKNNALTASVPVIFLTGVSELDSKLEGFDLGAVDYITKPFHPLEVVARVRLHLKLSIATNSLIASQTQKLKQLTEAQTSMLTRPEKYPAAKFGVHYLALHEAGGDFYEVIRISDDIYGYFVADFSGHDIKTSYLTSSVKGLLRQNCSLIYQPRETIKMINDVLVEILPDGKYLTACYLRLNRKKIIEIINAGHPPLCYIPAKGEPKVVQLDGDVVGIFKNVVYGRQTIPVKKGDRFYLYTDGLLETSENQKVWTENVDTMISACTGAADLPIREAPRKICDLICGSTELMDDIVILGVEV